MAPSDRRDDFAPRESHGLASPKVAGGFFRQAAFYEKAVVMNQDMNMGMMMVCMVAGVLFSLVILAFVVIQTVSQARILKEVRRIAQNSGRAASS